MPGLAENILIHEHKREALVTARDKLIAEADGACDMNRLIDRAFIFLHCAAECGGLYSDEPYLRMDGAAPPCVSVKISVPEQQATLTVDLAIDDVVSIARESNEHEPIQRAFRDRIAREVGELARYFPPQTWIVGRPGVIDEGYFETVHYSQLDAEDAAEEANSSDRESPRHDPDNELQVF